MSPNTTRHPFFVHRCLRHVSFVLERAGVRSEPVLLGVSGGSDSMALLELVGLLAPSLDLGLHVLCVDHGLRPEASEEGALVEGAARRWQAPFHAVAVRPDGDDEDSLRRARHAALEEVRARVGARFVLLGHTADDQIETIVFRFLRGAGFGGLAGMRERSAVHPRSGERIRPLLGLRRAELQRVLDARGVAWAEDATNVSARYARGRLRTSVLPALRAAFGEGALEHLLDVAPRWRADEDYLEKETDRLLAYASRRGRNGTDLDVEALSSAHEALRVRALRRWIAEATGMQPTSRDLAGVERWLAGARDGTGLDVAGARLALAGGRLTVVASETSTTPAHRPRKVRR